MERALIIKKQWLDRILDCGKVWEMRSTRTNVRGKIGLIESGSGLIVGQANLVDCGKRLQDKDIADTLPLHQVDDLQQLKYWRFPWVLDTPLRFKTPIPYNHPSGAVIWVKINKARRSK